MEKVTFVEVETMGEIVEHAIIDRGNGEFTSMLKSIYDAQIAASDTLPSNSSDFSQPIGGNE